MPTCEQVDNGRRLAMMLEKVAEEWPEHFNMKNYIQSLLGEFRNYDAAEEIVNHKLGYHPYECGTAGCALGWAPYATGIPKPSEESWIRYGARLLGLEHEVTQRGYNFYSCSDIEYLFFNYSQGIEGQQGAQDAAKRLWEWVERNQSDCT